MWTVNALPRRVIAEMPTTAQDGKKTEMMNIAQLGGALMHEDAAARGVHRVMIVSAVAALARGVRGSAEPTAALPFRRNGCGAGYERSS